MKKKLSLFIVFFAPVFLVVIYFLIPPRQARKAEVFLSGSTFRIAHRCGRNIYPENTLFACQSILEEDLAEFLEFDFHLTKDKIPVVIHDPTLDRTTNGTGTIAEKNWDEIKDLDAGYRFTQDGGKTFPYRGKGVKLETLDTFLKTLGKSKLMIEVKPDSREAADALLEAIDKYDLHNQVVVGSFHQNVKDYLREQNPRLAFFASKSEVIKWVILYKLGLSHLYLPPSESMALPPDMGIVSLTEDMIFKIHNQGIQVHVWTINDREEMKKWKDLGVDGIMSDNPDKFSRL